MKSNFPDKIKIGRKTYKVKYLTSSEARSVSNDLATDGAYFQTDKRIVIVVHNPGQAWVTLWHEMLHAIIDDAGLKIENEESVIDVLSTALVDLLAKNKGLYDG